MKIRKQIQYSLILVVTLTLILVMTMPAGAAWSPNNITALGDSITTGYNSAGYGNQFTYSWATGTSTSVNSMYSHVLAVNPLINGKRTNLAVSGKKMVDLNGQAAAVSTTAEYVTILMGANDVCTSSQTTMTTVANFKSQFETAMKTLTARAPNAKIYVLSIPDIYNLWSVLKGNSSARSTWAWFRICPSMLANPLSTAKADVDRRAAVRQRNIDFNAQLAQVCAMYAQCRFDNNAVFNTTFTASDVSRLDYFHPSVAGQAKLAKTAWDNAGLSSP